MSSLFPNKEVEMVSDVLSTSVTPKPELPKKLETNCFSLIHHNTKLIFLPACPPSTEDIKT